MPSNIVRTYIAGVKPYLGKTNDLTRFLTEIDDIVPTLASLTELEITIRFKQILSKLEERARHVLYEKPTTWEQVRTLLIRNFADNTDLGTMIVNMERTPYLGSIQRTYDSLLTSQVRMLERIELSRDPEEEKILLTRSVKRRTYMHFRKSLPQACQGALTSRNCENICDAIQILHEEEFLNYNRYYEDNRINNNRNYDHRPQRQYNQYNQRTNNPNHRPNFQNNNNRNLNPQSNTRNTWQPNYERGRQYNQNPQHNQFNNQQRAPRDRYQYNNQSQQTRQRFNQNNSVAPQPRAEPMEIDQNFHLLASDNQLTPK